MRHLCLILPCLAGLAFAPVASAEVIVREVWVRSTPGNARGSAAYAVIENTSAKADRLMEVSSPDADKVELHESKSSGGIMSMSPIETVPVPARGKLDLKPGGVHVMIMGLTRPLKAGETLPLTFSFEFFGDVDVNAMVAPLSASGYPGPKP
jgi:periplasmic copper chaperone A